jgi:hypothetical protein
MRYIWVYILVAVILMSVVHIVVYAAGARVNSGATECVNCSGVYWNVTNNNAQPVFVPSNSTKEMDAFRNNAPGVVIVSGCSCDRPNPPTGIINPTIKHGGEFGRIFNWTNGFCTAAPVTPPSYTGMRFVLRNVQTGAQASGMCSCTSTGKVELEPSSGGFDYYVYSYNACGNSDITVINLPN